MAQRGGYRAPSNPAAVSGPGALSKRTDGGPTQPATYISGLPYGQGQQTYSNQVSATMAGNPFPQQDMPTELFAPTMRPNEPITSGIDSGPGPGSEAMRRLPNAEPTVLSIIRDVAQYDASGDSELLYRALLDSGY
jgi:hypothetical protein